MWRCRCPPSKRRVTKPPSVSGTDSSSTPDAGIEPWLPIVAGAPRAACAWGSRDGGSGAVRGAVRLPPINCGASLAGNVSSIISSIIGSVDGLEDVWPGVRCVMAASRPADAGDDPTGAAAVGARGAAQLALAVADGADVLARGRRARGCFVTGVHRSGVRRLHR